jgi:hypothetical protein
MQNAKVKQRKVHNDDGCALRGLGVMWEVEEQSSVFSEACENLTIAYSECVNSCSIDNQQ